MSTFATKGTRSQNFMFLGPVQYFVNIVPFRSEPFISYKNDICENFFTLKYHCYMRKTVRNGTARNGTVHCSYILLGFYIYIYILRPGIARNMVKDASKLLCYKILKYSHHALSFIIFLKNTLFNPNSESQNKPT